MSSQITIQRTGSMYHAALRGFVASATQEENRASITAEIKKIYSPVCGMYCQKYADAFMADMSR